MKVGLFIPCIVDQFYPKTAWAVYHFLKAQNLNVDIPLQQTCCGQPLYNSGQHDMARECARKHIDCFKNYDVVVCPSGSCTSMFKNHFGQLMPECSIWLSLRERTYEFCEFLTDVVKIQNIDVRFPYKVGLHRSCHGLRELHLESASELASSSRSKIIELLEKVKDLELVELSRPDECCGFGGTFSTKEDVLSKTMGCDRIRDHLQAGAEVITSVDMSCLMHLEGLMKRNKHRVPVLHIAEILSGITPN